MLWTQISCQPKNVEQIKKMTKHAPRLTTFTTEGRGGTVTCIRSGTPQWAAPPKKLSFPRMSPVLRQKPRPAPVVPKRGGPSYFSTVCCRHVRNSWWVAAAGSSGAANAHRDSTTVASADWSNFPPLPSPATGDGSEGTPGGVMLIGAFCQPDP